MAKDCRRCWFYRPVGYLSAGISPKPTKVITCGLENQPLKNFSGCQSWMADQGAMINVDISDEAKDLAKKAGKKRWEKEKK